MKKIIKEKWNREDVLLLLSHGNNIGVELGVAKGGNSERMMKSGKFKKFFGVDMYADMHDTSEYKEALSRVGLFKDYSLLRMRFDEAVDLFEDNTFDFVYVDGYAHTGQLGGETIVEWYPKLKVGGVLAGDDYDEKDWPLVVESVNYIADQLNAELYITGVNKTDGYSQHASWALVKSNTDKKLHPSVKLVKKGKKQERIQALMRPYLIGVKNTIPVPIKNSIKKLLKK